jgi:hypothetical protein
MTTKLQCIFSQGRGMGEQVGGLGEHWRTLGEPRETWANLAFAMGLSYQTLL